MRNQSNRFAPLAQEAGPSTPSPPSTLTKFNDLPEEIQRSIFEIAYNSTKHKWRRRYVHVSHEVREWIDPLIYESIVLPGEFQDGHRRLQLYERTFRSKPKEFYAKNVRRIFTKNTLGHKSNDFELELLQVCDNLVGLECWSDAREELSTILKTKTWPSLKTLCIDIDLLPKDENTFRLPLFKYVTHLDLSSKKPQLPSWESLKSLDNLTHMRVDMLDGIECDLFQLVIDQAYAIATEAQKCFPPNLKHFVILVPVDTLYRICNMQYITPDQQRWEQVDSLQCGTFDPRIMLGCLGDWNCWCDTDYLEALLEKGEDPMFNMVYDAKILPTLKYPQFPQDYLEKGEKDTWAKVALKDRKRKKDLAMAEK